MNLHDADNATIFETREACLQWIGSRIVRFKLKMAKARTPDGKETYVSQKFDGKIINTLVEGFEESGTDEPLANYAAPVKQNGQWLAVMKVR